MRKRIGVENGKYYGVWKVYGKMVKLLFNRDTVKSIREKDKNLSTVLSIGIPVILVGGLIAIGASSLGSFCGGFGY